VSPKVRLPPSSYEASQGEQSAIDPEQHERETIAELQAMLAAKDKELSKLTAKYLEIHSRLDRVSKVLQDTAPPSE
jgi:hypothetical protein